MENRDWRFEIGLYYIRDDENLVVEIGLRIIPPSGRTAHKAPV
jgi:hypothetical protein